jgi:hypothetical protein
MEMASVARHERLLIAAKSGRRTRFGDFSFEAVFELDGMVRVFRSFFCAEFVIQEVVRGFLPCSPFKLHAATKLVAQALLDDFWGVDLNLERHSDLSQGMVTTAESGFGLQSVYALCQGLTFDADGIATWP